MMSSEDFFGFWRGFSEGAGLKNLALSRNDLSTITLAKAEAENQKRPLPSEFNSSRKLCWKCSKVKTLKNTDFDSTLIFGIPTLAPDSEP
jgi:hypothetical protein